MFGCVSWRTFVADLVAFVADLVADLLGPVADPVAGPACTADSEFIFQLV